MHRLGLAASARAEISSVVCFSMTGAAVPADIGAGSKPGSSGAAVQGGQGQEAPSL
jgi:hypothetical protein